MEFFALEILTELPFNARYDVQLPNDSHAGIRKFQNDEFLLFHRPAFTLFYTSGFLPLKSPRVYYFSIQIQLLVVLPQASSPISSKSVKKESLDFSWKKKKDFIIYTS